MKLELTRMPQDDETELGSTHFLGCPDVPSVWNEEAVFFNDEVFLGQINLKDVNSSILPKEGIIYFFIASESHPYRGIVRYTKDTSNLERVDFNVDLPFPCDLNREYQVKIVESDEDAEVAFLGKKPKLRNYHWNKDDVVLLTVDSKELSFFDEPVSFIIKEEDLKNQKFDKAFLSYNIEDIIEK